jgi:hypothetical protein
VALKLGVLASTQMTPGVAGEDGLVGELVLDLDVAGVAVLEVEGLVAVGVHVMDVEPSRLSLCRAECCRSRTAVIEIGVEGAVGECRRGCSARARGSLESRWMEPPNGVGPMVEACRGAVEVDAAEPLRREEGPGVVGRRVGVVEGDAVEVDVVVAVGEAAEVGLGLAEAGAVAVGGEGAGGHLDGLAVVGQRRGEVVDERLGDLGAGGVLIEQGVHGLRNPAKQLSECADDDV